MKIRHVAAIAGLATLFAASAASAVETRSVPVVTQVQGATFYRTSITLSNGNATISTPVEMLFSYRSPADGSFQTTTLTLNPTLGPHRVRFFDDIIQVFKDSGRIRAADVNLGLFGTLLVTFEALDIRAEAGVVARTYSPAPGGGTLGIAYEGRCFCETGSIFRVMGPGRGGVFGNDGSTRANLGIVNEGFGPSDVRITYYNGDTGVQLKQFFLSTVAGHDLEENEVYQLNNIFADSAIPSNVHTLAIQVEAQLANVYVSAYIVQLDNTTQDGSFFFLFEE
jgi:hypothetical protein